MPEINNIAAIISKISVVSTFFLSNLKLTFSDLLLKFKYAQVHYLYSYIYSPADHIQPQAKQI